MFVQRAFPILTLVFVFAQSIAPLQASESAEKHEHEEKDAVHLKSDALAAANLEIQPAGPGVILKTTDAPGEIQLNADQVVHVTPRASGVVERVLKSVGDSVGEGEVLSVLQSADLGNAKIEYFTAKVNLDLAQRDGQREKTVHDNTEKLLQLLKGTPEPAEIEKALLGASIGETKTKLLNAYAALRLSRSGWDRAQKLKGDGLISEANFDVAAKEVESAQAEFSGTFEEVQFGYKTRLLQAQRSVRLAEVACQNAERRLHILGLSDPQVSDLEKEKDIDVARYEMRAPISGTIIEKHIALGEQVAQERDCFVVADLSTVWCDLRVYVSQVSKIKAGQRVLLKAPGQEKPLEATVSVVGPLISEKSRAASIRLVMKNPAGLLRPGLFVTGSFVLEETKVPVAVPAQAIQRLENRNVVFVPGDEDGEFVAKPVRIGATDGSLVEIQAGLEAGAKVVVRNSFVLKAELGKGEGGEE